MTAPRVLIVDDDAALLRALPQALHIRMPDVAVETCDSAPVALEHIAATDYDAIVSDIKMPGMDGLALLERIRALRPETPTLLITGHGEQDLTIQALRGAAYDFIQKPIDRDYFIASLTRAIQVRQLRRQVEEQRHALERHAATLERTVEERTRELRAANAAKDEVIRARDAALAEARRATREQREARQQVEQLAAQLGEQAAQLDTIFEAMVDGVFVCDAEARIVLVNAHGAALLGLSVARTLQPIAEFAHMHTFTYLDGTPMPLDDFPLLRALRGETQTNLRLVIRQYETGRNVPVSVSSAPIRDQRGQISGAVAVASDVAELYRLERQKDEFLSIASHELKTPLTSLKGLAQITHRRLARAGSAEVPHVQKMERAIGRMETLVNDLLDISRIESGKLALRLESADLKALCAQVIDEQVAATERQIIFEAPEGPVEVEVDVDRIGQVLTNLLSNALKYSPEDSPVALSLAQSGDEVVLAVRDEGAGIPPAEQSHIFERFYRSPAVQVRSGSGVGLGLGLYITREIVERHGGRLWVESVADCGSTFYVALPLARATADATIQDPRHATGSLC